MSDSDDDCIEFDEWVMFFIIMIEYEEYRWANLIYYCIRMKYKDAKDFLDEYISTVYQGNSSFGFDNIAESLANLINLLDLREGLVKNLPKNSNEKKIKL